MIRFLVKSAFHVLDYVIFDCAQKFFAFLLCWWLIVHLALNIANNTFALNFLLELLEALFDVTGYVNFYIIGLCHRWKTPFQVN